MNKLISEIPLNHLIGFISVFLHEKLTPEGLQDMIDSVIEGKEPIELKYGDYSLGQWEALLNHMGGPKGINDIQEGEKKVQLVDNPNYHIFDQYGLRVSKSTQSEVVRPILESYMGYIKRSGLYSPDRINHGYSNLANPVLSFGDYQKKSHSLMKELKHHGRFRNIIKGPCFPIILSQQSTARLGDLEAMVYSLHNEAEASFKKNLRKINLKHMPKFWVEPELKTCNLVVHDKSRYGKIIEKIEEETFVALYFPAALWGFCINAQREQMDSLPGEFILSGPIDFLRALTMYPHLLYNEHFTPTYQLGAVGCGTTQSAFEFSMGGTMGFHTTDNMKNGLHNFSGGLLYIGKN